MTFAIIATGGKQYRVSEGSRLKIEKIDAEEGGEVVFDKVLLTSKGDAVQVGNPYVLGVAVHAKVLEQGRGDKKIVFRYHSKTRYHKKKGHRQDFTEVEIVKIS